MSKKAMVHVGRSADRARKILRENEAAELAAYDESILVRAESRCLEALTSEGFRVRAMSEPAVLLVRGFHLDTTAATSFVEDAQPSLETVAAAPPRVRHLVLRLAGPLHSQWKQPLEALGVKIYERLTQDAYLVKADDASLAELTALGFVESIYPYLPALKVSTRLLGFEMQAVLAGGEPGLSAAPLDEPAEPAAPAEEISDIDVLLPPSAAPEEVGNLEILLFETDDQGRVASALRNLGAEVVQVRSETLVVFADSRRIPEIAALAEVREINPHAEEQLHNNVAAGIIRIDALPNNFGLDGSGEIVAVADSGLDRGVDDGTMLADFRGRIVSIHPLGRPGDASDIHNHGTHVAGSVLGSGANSNERIQGMAPAARLVFQSLMDAQRRLRGLPPNLAEGLFDVARADGARIHNNSWGTRLSNGAYMANARQADRFAFRNRDFLILFSAGNEAPLKVTSPGTAKNVLTVGASESERSLPATVRFPQSPKHPAGVILRLAGRADNAAEVASFSCPGPVEEDRRKPDVVAPGTFILSTRSSASTADTGPDGLPGTHDEDGEFSHEEAVARGLPGGPLLGAGDRNAPAAPAGSGPNALENYCYDSGTSMATPITAGACALVRQFLREQLGHMPSSALLKALIVNGARNMGPGAPDDRQGWGRVDLESTLFPSGDPVAIDDNLEHAVETGQIRRYRLSVLSPAQPLAVTLVWRDPEGRRIQNRLHLRVIDSAGQEQSAEPVDRIRNNVQKVIITDPDTGVYTVEVEAVGISTGVPELAGTRQDFALAVSNTERLVRDF